MFHSFNTHQGFTLIEVMVTITIISILAAIITVALPKSRESQDLILAGQQLQSLVREAQKRALNEQRDQPCVDQAAEAKYCSDVGLHIETTTVRMFADIASDGDYTAADYTIYTADLVGGVSIETPLTLLFRAVPPTITLFVNNGETDAVTLRLQSGAVLHTLIVNRYGQIERQ